jgi:hypothetical protein
MEAKNETTCICGHSILDHHIVSPRICMAPDCPCTGWKVGTQTAMRIHAALNENTGLAIVKFEIGSTSINLNPDAAAQVGLELVAAAYAARAEQSMWKQERTSGH